MHERHAYPRRQFWLVSAGSLVATAVTWLLAPGSRDAVMTTYVGASISYTLYLNVTRAPNWAEIGHGVCSLLPIVLWRAEVGLSFEASVVIGCVLQALLIAVNAIHKKGPRPDRH